MYYASHHCCDWRVHIGISSTVRVIMEKSSVTFSITVLCRTVSNAFKKSRTKTRTYGLTDSIVHTVCRRATTAATVEPVGLNANWSAKKQLVVGLLDCRVDEWSDYESLKYLWQYGCDRDWSKISWMRQLFRLGYWHDDGGFPLTWYHTCNDRLVEKLCDRCRKNWGSHSQEWGGYSIQTCM